MTDQPLPETVDEAIEYLLSKLDEENRHALKNMKREELIKLHRTYGMGVRNSLGLWGQNTKLRADPEIAGMFPDDASMYIIERIWDRLNSQNHT
jgi:hypothetical protein